MLATYTAVGISRRRDTAVMDRKVYRRVTALMVPLRVEVNIANLARLRIGIHTISTTSTVHPRPAPATSPRSFGAD